MKKKVCLIYNFAQHYRASIFKLLANNIPIDFIFGDRYEDVIKIDYTNITANIKEVKNITVIAPFTFQKKVVSLTKLDYSSFLMIGDIHSLSTWIILLKLKFSKKKTFLWTHGWYGRESLIKALIKKVFFGLADGLFLYGNYAKKLMIAKGFNPSKLHVIYNSLDYDQHLELRNRLKKSDIFNDHYKNNNTNLIFIGRLTQNKQLDILIQALSIINLSNPKYNLTIIGTGEKENELKLMAKDYESQQFIWFYGSCYDEKKIGELMYNADICVSPGNVGLTAIHAMSFGTPVITHNTFSLQMPEFEAIEDGMTGTFFRQGDTQSLAECIQKWREQSKDRELIRQNCFKIIDTKYNPYIQLETFKKVLLYD